LDWYVTHAHNMYLQVLAEVGLVGALAGGAAVASVAWLMWRAFRGGDSLRRRWAWGALFVFTYLGIASLVDNYANMPAVMLLAAIPLAVLDGSADRRLGIPGLSLGLSRRLASLVRAALWVACLVAIVGLARSESIASEHARAVGLIDDGDWEAAAPLVTSASSADPDMIAYQVTRGQVASQMDDWATALDAYRRAAETDDLPASWLGVAQAQLGLGGPTADVAESLARALRIGTQQEGILYAAASIYDRLGLVDEADGAYAAALAGMPSLAADPFWMSDPDLVARFVGIRDQAIERAGTSGWSVALMAGDVDRARHLAASLPPGGHERESLVVEAWAGGEEAMGELRRQVAADPRDSWLHSWASLIQLRRGAPQEADRLRRLATFNWEGGELPGFEFRRGEDDEPGEVPAGTRGAYYGEWLYRRSMPIRQLPPGLPQLVYQDFGLTE
jgi:tetratricopeptide (TPR) repeat protein